MSLDRLRPFRRGLAIAATSLAVAIAVAAPRADRGAGRRPAAAPAESAAALAARLQTRYDAIKDFTADFTQTYEGGVLRRKTTESRHAAGQEAGPDAVGVQDARKRSCSSRTAASCTPGSRPTGR